MGFLVEVIVALLIVGLIIWLLGYLPIDPKIRQIITVILVVVIIIWALYFLLGVLPSGGLSFRR